MHRRQFLKAAVAGAVVLPFASYTSSAARAAATTPTATPNAAPAPGWRRHEVTTQVTIDFPKGVTRVWLPLPLAENTDYQRTLSITREASGALLRTEFDPHYGAAMLCAEWQGPDESGGAGVTPVLTVVSQIETRDRHVALDRPASQPPLTKEQLALWLQPTDLLPTDGIVRDKAQEIMRILPQDASQIDRARAIYDWVVDNTFRDPKTLGCGVGDVESMLESGNLSGKCADLSAVFVALARAAGIPARDVYGIRTAVSARGYKSLGKAGDITRAQHCRAEFYAPGHGWIPVDPADVRKVMLEEEKGGLPVNDPRVVAIRDYLFGNWEMNWMAYNYAHDLILPGSALGARGKIGFLMYPNGETADGRLDPLDPANFRYSITAREVTA